MTRLKPIEADHPQSIPRQVLTLTLALAVLAGLLALAGWVVWLVAGWVDWRWVGGVGLLILVICAFSYAADRAR